VVEEAQPATTFEIFFDLVLVFALTRITEFMALEPRPVRLVQGLLLLLWFWYAWTCYAWLGNRTRADVGLVQAGITVAMAGLFVAALVIPEAWQQGYGLDAPLILALAYVAIRGLHLALYLYSAGDDIESRAQVRRFAVPTTIAWIPLIAGAAIGNTAQTALWTVAFIVDYGGGRIASRFSRWEIRSPPHFTERHGLVLIIALGESLISVGVGAGSAVLNGRYWRPHCWPSRRQFACGGCTSRTRHRPPVVPSPTLHTVPCSASGWLPTPTVWPTFPSSPVSSTSLSA
jgi:low temperature requirement protein LtrA